MSNITSMVGDALKTPHGKITRYLVSLYQKKSSPFQGEVARSAGGVNGKPPLNPLLEKEGKIRKADGPAASCEELQVKALGFAP